MACGNCGCGSGSKNDGEVKGCQSSGGCSSGGCNRMNVFNWLADIPLSDLGKPFPIVEISFNNGSRKDFFRNDHILHLDKGTLVAVEGSSGFDVGQISLTGELVKLQMKKYGVSESPDIKKILRIATDSDINLFQQSKDKEKSILIQSRAIAKTLNLEMKIAEAELQADGKKVCFFYTADSRVDFRELIKIYAGEFKAKIEMRQIGARQESSKVGGIGSCGRELCCSSWLSDFKTVNTTTARYQNLSINQAKLSGQCGRLKCCLNYELDTYMDALKIFPDHAEHLELVSGRAFLIKKDIFRNLIWYGVPGSSRQYPLSIERVVEILALNAKGEKVAELEAEEIVNLKSNKQKTIEVGFINDVGQLTLSSLNKSSKKKKNHNSSGSDRDRNQQVGGREQRDFRNKTKPQQKQQSSEGQTDERKSLKPQQANAPRQNAEKRPQHPNQRKENRGPKSNNESAKPKENSLNPNRRPPREPRPPREQRPNESREPRVNKEGQNAAKLNPNNNGGKGKPQHKRPHPPRDGQGGEHNKSV